MGKPRLSVSLEDDHDGHEIVILFVPDKDKSEHYHIELNTEGAEQLAAALDRFVAGDYEDIAYDIPVEGVM